MSEYTDKVDTYRGWGASAVIVEQLKEALNYLSGMYCYYVGISYTFYRACFRHRRLDMQSSDFETDL